MESEELRILIAQEPAWTVSINGKEFVPLSAVDIEIVGDRIRIGGRSRRITRMDWLRPNVVRLRTRTDTLTLYPGERLPPEVNARRRRSAFQSLLARNLARHYKTSIPTKSCGPDGPYLRLPIGKHAVIAVGPEEPTPVINGIMRAAILWSAKLRHPISIVLPAQHSRTIVTRLHSMPELRETFDWLQWDGEKIETLDMALPDSESYVRDYRAPEMHAGMQSEAARICALAPDLLQAVPHIPTGAISIRFRGLEVARVEPGGTSWPLGEPLEPVLEILAHDRCYGSRHPLARAYEERWLESNLIRQIPDLVPVCPEWIYPQVPSFAGEERSIIDLLAITKDGRLVVIEVKASADPELPFQAFDYWLAVERHRKAGDFTAKGYFSGQTIRDEPALLVVVAPLLAFHRTTERLVAALPQNLPLMQIGINQAWKRSIKILRRKGALG